MVVCVVVSVEWWWCDGSVVIIMASEIKIIVKQFFNGSFTHTILQLVIFQKTGKAINKNQ